MTTPSAIWRVVNLPFIALVTMFPMRAAGKVRSNFVESFDSKDNKVELTQSRAMPMSTRA